MENRPVIPLYQSPDGSGLSGMPLRRHAPQGMAGRTHRLQPHPLDHGRSGSLGRASRPRALLQPNSPVAAGLAPAQLPAAAQGPFLEGPSDPESPKPGCPNDASPDPQSLEPFGHSERTSPNSKVPGPPHAANSQKSMPIPSDIGQECPRSAAAGRRPWPITSRGESSLNTRGDGRSNCSNWMF